MVLVLSVIIFFLVLLLNPVFAFLMATLPAVPDVLWILVRTVLQVVLLTYMVMPAVSRVLADWLGR